VGPCIELILRRILRKGAGGGGEGKRRRRRRRVIAAIFFNAAFSPDIRSHIHQHRRTHAHTCTHLCTHAVVDRSGPRPISVSTLHKTKAKLVVDPAAQSLLFHHGKWARVLHPEAPIEGTTKVTNGRGLRASVPTRAITKTKTAIQRATQRLSSVSRTMNMKRVGQRNRTSRRCVCPSMPSLSILTPLLSSVSVDPYDILSCLITQLGSSKENKRQKIRGAQAACPRRPLFQEASIPGCASCREGGP
jgi:hypothetical protein